MKISTIYKAYKFLRKMKKVDKELARGKSTLNEARLYLGLPSITEGNNYFVPQDT